jgi:hypothetical protein
MRIPAALPRARDGELAGQRRCLRRAAAGAIAATLVLLMPCGSTLAVEADTYLLVPTVTAGEREIDWHSGVGSAGATTTLRRNMGVGVGIGVTNNWFTELAVEYRHGQHFGMVYDAMEWENVFQLAEPNEWPIDVGMALQVEIPRDSEEGITTRVGPLLQKDFGNFEVNANVLLDRHFRGRGFESTQIQYQGQLKYRYSQPLEFGVQAFGNLGTRLQSWAAYPQQAHRIGPVVLGRFRLPKEQGLSYNLGFLIGTTAHSPDRTLRFQIEYEF